MKRAALFILLACAAVRAQENHQGPVVMPATNSADASLMPDVNVSASASPVMPMATPQTNSAPTPANPSSDQGPSPLQNLAPATGGTNGQKEDIYDIRPPFFYLKPLTWLWVVLGALVLISLLVTLWYLFQPLRAFRAKTPWDLALERLEKARGMLSEENPEPYAVFVSETVRNYLDARFRTPITRRTTEEFLRQMESDANTPLLAPHRDLLRHFLEACDLVKFAHYQPERSELEQVQERAVSFVTATRPTEGVPA